jgi:hypothetical protein
MSSFSLQHHYEDPECEGGQYPSSERQCVLAMPSPSLSCAFKVAGTVSRASSLNIVGTELLAEQNHHAALHTFNEAFRAVVAAGDTIKQEKVSDAPDDHSCTQTSGNPPEQNKNNRPNLEIAVDADDHQGQESVLRKGAVAHDDGSLLEPLLLPSSTSSEEAERWVFMASMRLMFNGALTHFLCQEMVQAEHLCLVAIGLAQEQEPGDEDMDDDFMMEGREEDPLLVLKLKKTEHERKSIMLLVFHLLGLVQGTTTTRRHTHVVAQGIVPITVVPDEQSAIRVEESLDSFQDALEIAEDMYGSRHMIIASIYFSIGRVLLTQGCLQGATFAFDTVKSIYDCPRVPALTGGGISGDVIPGRGESSNNNSNNGASIVEDFVFDLESLDYSVRDEQVLDMLLQGGFCPTAPAA